GAVQALDASRQRRDGERYGAREGDRADRAVAAASRERAARDDEEIRGIVTDDRSTHFPTQNAANTRSSTSSGVTAPISSSSASTAARRWVAVAAASTPAIRADQNASSSARARSNAVRWRARVTTGSTSPSASRLPNATSASRRRRSALPS